MSISCPYCQYTIQVKTPKSGKFAPKCPKCQKPFGLVIPEDVTAAWTVTPLKVSEGSSETPPETRRTQPEPVPTSSPSNQSMDTPSAGQSQVNQVTQATGVLEQKPQSLEQTAPQSLANLNSYTDQTQPAQSPTNLAPAQATRPTTPAEVNISDPSKVVDSKAVKSDLDIPNTLGGYEIVKELGRGGMGAVFLARQISLDRSVALKVMNARWARDAIFVARFTREAYAAAQLTHHNVVQIYDIGNQNNINYFSMEFVEGRSLGDLVKKEGKIETEEAVGYILQAARGLKFAHDRGMIHRDVKPDNLMLNTHGIVKVADLGLVKTPNMTEAEEAVPSSSKSSKPNSTGLRSLPADMTHAKIAMGSPAYMSPEQCRDAANVDHRADIYSLGCTLYVMLTGRTPFQGNTAFEVMTKHASEDPIPPEQIAQRVPKEVSSILMKMMAKAPEDRFPDMGAVIRALENWLGVRSSGGFSPREEQLSTLERCVQQFNEAPAALLRRKLILGFFGGSSLAAIICLFISPLVSGGIVALMLQTVLIYFVLNGITQKTHLFSKVREVVLGNRILDWLIAVVAFALFLGILYMTGLLWIWLGFGLLAAGFAFGLHQWMDRNLHAQRQPAIQECEQMFKRMRIQGLEEENLRLFVAKCSGNQWEEFFESLFGYEEKMKARLDVLSGESGRNRLKWGTWREPIITWLDGILRSRKEAKERTVLQKIEAKKLEAEGLSKKEAAEQAEAAAYHLVDQAAVLKEVANRTQGPVDQTTAQTRPLPNVNVQEMLQRVERAPKKLVRRKRNPIQWLMELIFSGKVRFLLGVLLITGAVLWMKQNVDFAKLATEAQQVAGNTKADTEDIKQKLSMLPSLLDLDKEWKPLELKLVPGLITNFFDHINPLLAGLLLLISLFFRGVIMSFLLLVAAGVILVGHKFGIPDLGPIKDYQASMIIGLGIGLVGFVLARKKQ